MTTYRLKMDPAAEAVYDALPQVASEQLTLALADACNDPLGTTEPYGHDDPVMRMIITEHVSAVLMVGHNRKTITLLQISYLG